MQKKSLYKHQSENTFKTWFLMVGFFVFIIGLGWFFDLYYGNSFFLLVAIIISLIMNFVSYFYSDKIALSVSKAKPADEKQYKELHNILENLSITAGLPKPKLYIISDSSPNAFATGRNKNNAAVAVTTGLLQLLEKSEIEGVIAHELAHIGNKDILLQTIVVVLVGVITLLSDMFLRASLFGGRDSENGGGQIGILLIIIGFVLMLLSPFVATIIQLAISRKREYLADATGALITRYPEGLASALAKISSYSKGIKNKNHATAHLFIADPLGGDKNNNGIPDYKEGKKKGFLNIMFDTHPPAADRIDALLGKK